jgi:pimeloyl-ACP methyl ester carboxylesterase
VIRSAFAPLIKAPTPILWGDQDSLFAAPEQALWAALTEAQVVTFEGLGHSMFWEEPKTAGQLLTVF